MPPTLVWLAVFLVLALLAVVPVHFHLAAMRKLQQGGARPGARAVPQATRRTRPCPQCGHPTGSDSAFCEKCGVPMMLWQLKLAREVAAPANGAAVAAARAHPLPIIQQDVCIGCSACVNACDQKVLAIVAGKSTVVNPGACTGAAACAEVCPTGACQLEGDGAARRMEVPDISADFETNQKGIYAVGEVGGIGLIKNAVNEGALVVERIKAKHVKRDGVLDVVFVGAGPAGLSASLAAKEAGLSFKVLEQGAFADTIRRFPNKKIVMAEPVRVPMYGSLWMSDAPKEALLKVWQTIIESAGIQINEHEQVTGVSRTPDGGFSVVTPKQVYRSQKVVLAIGKRGSPRKLPARGAELPKVMYSLTDAAQYSNAHVLVVGGGDSAAEAAIGLSAQPGNQVALSYRKKEFGRLKDKNRDALSRAFASGSVRFLGGSQVAEVADKAVVLEHEGGRRERLANDHVFAMLGGTPPNEFLHGMGIRIVTKEVSGP